MNIVIGVIIMFFELILSLAVFMSALEVIRGEKTATIKGVLLWILGLIILAILVALNSEFIGDSGIIFEPRRT
ncbi:hypothetical protein OAW23_10665 [Flavobacteriales bacterium]|nr:hypothetical protein [Flavobacteriales bacterium]